MSKAHLFICTPMYGGMTTGYYCQSLVNTTAVMRANDIDMSFSCMFNESLIQRGRNALAHGFLNKKEATHLMFIDAELTYQTWQMRQLSELNQNNRIQSRERSHSERNVDV